MMINYIYMLFLALFFIISPLKTWATGAETSIPLKPQMTSKKLSRPLRKIKIFETNEQLNTSTGSADVVTKKELASKNYTDVNRVLKSMPGVYVQEEDAFGLRPNIGLRGAHPHRSRKITILEDRILIGPAPYSAPAAYYFPQMTRIENLEVFKGPSSVKYGPNSIGGAINLVTTSIPSQSLQKIDLAGGSHGFRKSHLVIGGTNKSWGWLVDAARLQSTGFKQLQTSEDTGFKKNDAMIKLRWSPPSDMYQSLDLKLNFSDENSHETYLGLNSNDFADQPFRRYAASQNDQMIWNHKQYQLHYTRELANESMVWASLYNHEFRRNWSKFMRFSDPSINVNEVLKNPTGGYQGYYDVLRGADDSGNILSDHLVIGNNRRDYYSRGLQLGGDIWIQKQSNISQKLTLGARFHNDQIERDHTEDQYKMVTGRLVADGTGRMEGDQNRDTTWAQTFVVSDEILSGKWKWDIGSRQEFVQSARQQLDKSGQRIEYSDQVNVSGLGTFYKANKHWGLLAGINQGVAMVTPGQSADVEPERSLNYEMGLRYTGPVQLSMISFFSDYSNIKGVCTFSSGCTGADLDQEFNGGKARIFGLESSLNSTVRYNSWNFPLKSSLTYTRAEFANSFDSQNKEWGQGFIESGDPLPYIPQWQAALSLGVEKSHWGSEFNIKWSGKMFDQSLKQDRLEISAHGLIDWVLRYKWNNYKALLRVDNILNHSYIVSQRPFGARPGKPQSVVFGLEATL